MSAPTPPRFVTVKECAALFRVSQMTVLRMIDRGEIAATRIGRSVRIPRAELERLARPTSAPAPALPETREVDA